MSSHLISKHLFSCLTCPDFQATERIFRKVIHPGLDSLRLVDKNGIPINAPLNSMKQKMFILSPRGVPTRVTNHAYSGQPMRMSRPYSEGVSWTVFTSIIHGHLEHPSSRYSEYLKCWNPFILARICLTGFRIEKFVFSKWLSSSQWTTLFGKSKLGLGFLHNL